MAATLNGYKLITEFTAVGSGSARWCFAVKDGAEYFVKEFLSPIYPNEDTNLPENVIKARLKLCEDFEAQKRRLYNELSAADNGNIVYVKEFFRVSGKYYITTSKVPEASITMNDARLLSAESKAIIMKILVHSLMRLRDRGIVHADLKPTNVMLKRTTGNFYTLKLIDFDNSFFEDSPPIEADDVQGDPVYLAPETFLRMCERDAKLTHKLDIFALGIMFHEILESRLPDIDHKYSYIYEAALGGGKVSVSPGLSAPMANMIAKMLSVNPDDRPEYEEIFAVLTSASAPATIPARPLSAPASSETRVAKRWFKPAGDL